MQVITYSLKSSIVDDIESDIQVTGWAVIDTRGAISFQFYFLSIFNSGRNSNTYIFPIDGYCLLVRLKGVFNIQLQLCIIILASKSCFTFSSTLPRTTK